jgi:hypothetical protein
VRLVRAAILCCRVFTKASTPSAELMTASIFMIHTEDYTLIRTTDVPLDREPENAASFEEIDYLPRSRAPGATPQISR